MLLQKNRDGRLTGTSLGHADHEIVERILVSIDFDSAVGRDFDLGIFFNSELVEQWLIENDRDAIACPRELLARRAG